MSTKVSVSETQLDDPVRSEDFKDIYANQVRLGVTLTDFVIVFGVADDRGSVTELKDLAAVRLSPGTMKMLLTQMSSIMAAYEQACGPVPMLAIDRSSEKEMMSRVTENLEQMISGKSQVRRTLKTPS